jgi:hypothetical protein
MKHLQEIAAGNIIPNPKRYLWQMDVTLQCKLETTAGRMENM